MYARDNGWEHYSHDPGLLDRSYNMNVDELEENISFAGRAEQFAADWLAQTNLQTTLRPKYLFACAGGEGERFVKVSYQTCWNGVPISDVALEYHLSITGSDQPEETCRYADQETGEPLPGRGVVQLYRTSYDLYDAVPYWAFYAKDRQERELIFYVNCLTGKVQILDNHLSGIDWYNSAGGQPVSGNVSGGRCGCRSHAGGDRVCHPGQSVDVRGSPVPTP